MRWITALVLSLILVLQYKLWFADGGVPQLTKLKDEYQTVLQHNHRLKRRNNAMLAEIQNLKKGDEAIEARARLELGMIKRGEVYYDVIERTPNSSKSN